MKVTYQFQESKKGEPNGGEDRLFVSDDFIAVIDGATSKSGEKFDGKTGGVLAAEAIVDALKSLPKTSDAFNAVAHLTAAVQENVINKYVSHMNNATYIGDRPNASVVICSKEKQEIWRIGDGHFKNGYNGTIHGKKEIDTINSGLRAAYIAAMLSRGTTTIESLLEKDLGREIIMPSLTAQPFLMNNEHSDLGYGVIDGRMVPERFVEIYKVDEGSKIVLASDGINDELYHSEKSMMKAIAEQLEYYKQDPLMIGKYKSTKGLATGQKYHDDVSVIAFTL